MFGILYFLYNTIGLLISGGIATKENNDAIKRGLEKQKEGKNRAGIYTDRLGATRLLSNNKIVNIDNLYCAEAKGEDCYMRDQYDNPIRNMSEEIRQERLSEAMIKNDPRISVIEWKQGIPSNLAGVKGRPYYAGRQYKDLTNGKIYVCRRLRIPDEIADKKWTHTTFYMDVDTGLLVRETDSSKELRKRGKETIPSEKVCERFVKYFNEKQSLKGYFHDSAYPNPKYLDMNGNEKEFDKVIRMGWYFCNREDALDKV